MTTPSESADPEAAVAAQLRRIALALHEGSHDPERYAEALGHLSATAHALSGGSPRLRWYERETDTAKPARNRDLSAFSGTLNAAAPPMRLEVGTLDDGTEVMLGHVRLDRLREGPPANVHGGIIAGLFDEVMGAATRLSGRAGAVTGRLTVRYRSGTPLDEDLEFRAWIGDERTRRVIIKADCRAVGSESVTAEAEAVFVRRTR